MKNLFSRGIAALTATSLSFAAVPAFAMGGQGMGMHFGFGLQARSGEERAVTAESRLEAMTERCDRIENEEKKEKCHSMMTKLSAHVDARAKRIEDRPDRPATVENIDGHIDHILNRTFRAVATLARRVCSGDETVSVSQCMTTIKSRLQTRVSAMIDAAFTAAVENE